MKRCFITFMCFIFFMGCNQSYKKDKDISNGLSIGKEYGSDMEPHDFMFMQRAYPTGSIDTKAYGNALSWRKQFTNRSQFSGGSWEFIGPSNIGGRITDIEVPSNQPETYYLGAASGGVFKSMDGGDSWIPVFDEQGSLSIGDIEVSDTDNGIVWVGTGEVNAGGGSLAYDGVGMFKSIDGGNSWEPKGLPNVGSIGKILIDPANDNTLYVGAMGPLFRDDENRGVYKTIDGGTTWEKVLFVDDITGVIDMAIHPENGTIVYAATWQRIRRPDYREYGGAGSGLYKSIDGGVTWGEMTNGLPTAPEDKGRISIDISKSNPNVLYARYADAIGNIQGVYKTIDGGDTWQEMNSSQLINVGFHWWFQGIVIDPTDENIIYNVGFEVQKSIDGGTTWSNTFNGVHVDQHALEFNPNVPGEVLLGNDGGFYKSNDDGASWTKDNTLPITQVYRMTVDATNENKIYAGAQDNSTIRTTTGNVDDYAIINGGDGFQSLVDFNDTNTIYVLSQFGDLRKSINNGTSFTSALNGITPSDRNNWDTPIVMDSQDSQTLYYGTQRLWKTTNGAADWFPISPDLTNGSGEGNLSFGTITSIKVANFDNNIIYVGTDDGNVWVTKDGGITMNNISSTLPNRWVTKVNTSIYDDSLVYVTFSGYRYGEDEGHIYRSFDYGDTWEDISGNLPNIPVNDIEETNYSGTFIATDVGVYSSTNGVSWAAITDLPPVVVTDLYFDNKAQYYIYAATYGRSIHRTYTGEVGVDEQNFDEVSVYPNPTEDYFYINSRGYVDDLEVSVYSQAGQIVKHEKVAANNSKIDIRILTSGLYFVELTSNSKRKLVKLVIK